MEFTYNSVSLFLKVAGALVHRPCTRTLPSCMCMLLLRCAMYSSSSYSIHILYPNRGQHSPWAMASIVIFDRDVNSTRGCGYPRILNPMDAGAGLIFHPWVDPHPHPHIAGAGADLRFHPRVDPHSSGKKTTTQPI